jgi:DNA replication protein DnaD
MQNCNKGWIKLYRVILAKSIWLQSTPEQKTILIALLLMANHEGKEWQWKGKTFKVNSGQFITSLDSIIKKCGKGISKQNVRCALKRFEKYGFLTDEATNTERRITIINWELYQKEIMPV